jgi:hypothetical protein
VIIYLSLLVCLVGLVIYALSTTAKPQEIGRLMFACGLLAFLFMIGNGQSLTLLKH